jgi:hypothetical protein
VYHDGKMMAEKLEVAEYREFYVSGQGSIFVFLWLMLSENRRSLRYLTTSRPSGPVTAEAVVWCVGVKTPQILTSTHCLTNAHL